MSYAKLEEWRTHLEVVISNNMEILRDGQVQLGATRYDDYACCQRRMMDQMRIGTVSRHTLLYVLEIRSDNLGPIGFTCVQGW
jgi:hypothetical protein